MSPEPWWLGLVDPIRHDRLTKASVLLAHASTLRPAHLGSAGAADSSCPDGASYTYSDGNSYRDADACDHPFGHTRSHAYGYPFGHTDSHAAGDTNTDRHPFNRFNDS